jgi:hypothetical protein
MNTSIIIPGKITSVAPKPTKAQLIEALVERARKQITSGLQKKELKKSSLF